MSQYDVAIVGAGPAGLMAALRAADLGLKTVLIERRRDITAITRACCQQLIMDEDFQGETIRLEDDRVVFTRNQFDVAYSGPRLPVPEKYFISSAGHRVRFANPDGSPIVIVIDKGQLLGGLAERCSRQGVRLLSGTGVTAAEDIGTGVTLTCRAGTAEETVSARRLVIAEGVNAALAGRLGLNEGRPCFARALVAMCIVEGWQESGPLALRSYMGTAYRSFTPVITGPALGGPGRTYIAMIGTRDRRPLEAFQDLCTDSPLSATLGGIETVGTLACTATAYASLCVPHAGNVLVIGDAAAYVEVEMQGALTCGFQAGAAVARELEQGDGFSRYTQWWQQSFEFNGDDYLQVAQGFALVPTYADEEIDYLFALIQETTLPGTYNQYRSPRLLWEAINSHSDRIEKERPELHAKIRSKQLSLSDTLQSV